MSKKDRMCHFFRRLFDHLPVQILKSDLYHRILRKKSIRSELMILECSFPLNMIGISVIQLHNSPDTNVPHGATINISTCCFHHHCVPSFRHVCLRFVNARRRILPHLLKSENKKRVAQHLPPIRLNPCARYSDYFRPGASKEPNPNLGAKKKPKKEVVNGSPSRSSTSSSHGNQVHGDELESPTHWTDIHNQSTEHDSSLRRMSCDSHQSMRSLQSPPHVTTQRPGMDYFMDRPLLSDINVRHHPNTVTSPTAANQSVAQFPHYNTSAFSDTRPTPHDVVSPTECHSSGQYRTPSSFDSSHSTTHYSSTVQPVHAGLSPLVHSHVNSPPAVAMQQTHMTSAPAAVHIQPTYPTHGGWSRGKVIVNDGKPSKSPIFQSQTHIDVISPLM